MICACLFRPQRQPLHATAAGLAHAAKKRRIGPKTILAACSLAISLGTAEMLFRSSLRDRGFAGTATPDQYQFYKYDHLLGWANAPGQARIFERAEFSYPLEINEHGMRQREIAKNKPAGTTRIAVVGDSFVWGIGVKNEDRFTELVEQDLQATEVLNFGVVGYGPIQYHLIPPPESWHSTPSL